MNNKTKIKNKLLSKRNPNEYGLWKINGEPFGGNLHGGSDETPHLGYFEGYYKDAVEKAIELEGFFIDDYWWPKELGDTKNGGKIIKVKVNKL